MLNTPFTATDCLLHLHCHSRPPKLVLQQGHCLPLALMSHVPMAPVHGCHSMSHGDYKLQSFFQLSGESIAVVEGTLMSMNFFLSPHDGHALFHHAVVSQKMFEILHLMGGNPLHHNFKYRIFLLHSYPVHSMHIYMHVSGLYLDCRFFNLLMYSFIGLSHHQVMGVGLSSGPWSDSIQDGLHSFSIQLCCNTAQSICNSVVSSFLIFDAKCESCQHLHPMMLGSI